jgi:hypothetical protein
MNLLWYDVIWYGWVKAKKASERNDR